MKLPFPTPEMIGAATRFIADRFGIPEAEALEVAETLLGQVWGAAPKDDEDEQS